MSGRMPQNDASEDEDEFFAPESADTSAVGSRLGSLFSHAGRADGNASLTYKAPKQPSLKEESASEQQQKASATDADGAPVRVLHATAIHAFLWKDGQYTPQGKIGAALLGNRVKKDFKILLYQSNKQPIGQATVTPSMALNVNDNNYISFFDDRSVSWSLAFENENQMLEFLKWVLAIKGLLFDEHHKEILSINIGEGDGNPVSEGDALEIEYTEFLVEDGPLITEFNGTLNSDQKPLRVKLSKGEAPKGWMDGLLGMKKRGKRLFVIPPDLGYSGHDSSPSFPTNTPLMVYAIVKRVKFSKKRPGSDETARERKLSSDSVASSSVDVEPSSGIIDPGPRQAVDNSVPQKSASESEVNKKADLINRMARLGHAVIGAVPGHHLGLPDLHDHGPIAQGATSFKPVAPPRPSTLQNPLAVVCADMSLARPVITQSIAGVTKSSSDGSISPRARSTVAPSSATTDNAASQGLLQPHNAFELGAIPFPPLSSSTGSALPYIYPFSYPPQSYFLQPPFLPLSLPPTSSSDAGTLASSTSAAVDKQAILDEIQKCHLHLQDALTKTLVTNLSGILKKFTDIGESIESKLAGSLPSSSAAPRSDADSEQPQTRDVIGITPPIAMADIVSKLDRIDSHIQNLSTPRVGSIMTKPAELGQQIGAMKNDSVHSSLASNSAETDHGDADDGTTKLPDVVQLLEALTENVSSLQSAIDKVNAAYSELTAENEWKEKYQMLKLQAVAMKEKYEGRIEELEAQLQHEASASEEEKVKKIMSSFYKDICQRFQSGEQFNRDYIRRTILDTVKMSTLQVLNEETDKHTDIVENSSVNDPTPDSNQEIVSMQSESMFDGGEHEDEADGKGDGKTDVGFNQDQNANTQ